MLQFVCVYGNTGGTGGRAALATKRVLAVKSNFAIYHLVNFVVGRAGGMWLWLRLDSTRLSPAKTGGQLNF